MTKTAFEFHHSARAVEKFAAAQTQLQANTVSPLVPSQFDRDRIADAGM
jgi:hypothetical protein